MTSSPEEEAKSGKIDLKEAPVFKTVLAEVRVAFKDHYGIKPKDLPVLTPDAIQFVSPGKFRHIQEHPFVDYRKNLLIITLAALGVKEEGGLAQETTIFADRFSGSNTVYALEGAFRGLVSEDPLDRVLHAVTLGEHLIAMNLALLPKMVEIDRRPWQPILKVEISDYLLGYADKIPPENQDKLLQAVENFGLFVDDPNSVAVYAFGGEILAMLKSGQVQQPLILLSSEFNRRIMLYLGRSLREQIIDRLTGRSVELKQFLLTKLHESLVKGGLLMDELEERSDLEDILTRLDWVASDLFRHYRNSRFPSLYLERRRAFDQLSEPRRSLKALPPYPLD